VCDGNQKLYHFLLVWKHNGMFCIKIGALTFPDATYHCWDSIQFVLRITKFHNMQIFPPSHNFLFLLSKHSPFHPCNKLSVHSLLHSWYDNNMYKHKLGFAAVTCDKRAIFIYTTLHFTLTNRLRNLFEVISEIWHSSMYSLIWIALPDKMLLKTFSSILHL